MKNTHYLFTITITSAILLMSCKSKISNINVDKKYETETIKGEDIELRNKLRSNRHRVRNKYRNTDIVNIINTNFHFNK